MLISNTICLLGLHTTYKQCSIYITYFTMAYKKYRSVNITATLSQHCHIVVKSSLMLWQCLTTFCGQCNIHMDPQPFTASQVCKVRIWNLVPFRSAKKSMPPPLSLFCGTERNEISNFDHAYLWSCQGLGIHVSCTYYNTESVTYGIPSQQANGIDITLLQHWSRFINIETLFQCYLPIGMSWQCYI